MLTSLGNLSLSIFIASASSPSAYGSFAILYSIYWLAVGLTRAAVGETSLTTGARQTGDLIAPIVIAAFVGLIASLVALAIGVFSSNLFLVAGFWALIPLCVQDNLRYLAFSKKRPAVALASDIVMLIIQTLGGFLLHQISHNATAWITAWGASAVLSAIIALLQVRPRGSWSDIGSWLRVNAVLARNVSADFWLNTGAQQAIVFAIPLVAQLATLGALKAAQVSAGPLNVLLTSISLTLLPRLFESPHTGSARRAVARAVMLIWAVSVTYALGLELLPADLLAAAFGASWQYAQPLVVVICLQVAVNGTGQVCTYFLRAQKASHVAVVARLICVAPIVVAPLLGAATFGGLGAALGLLAGSILFSAAILIATARIGHYTSPTTS